MVRKAHGYWVAGQRLCAHERALRFFFEAEFLNFPGNGVAADSQCESGFDPPSAGVCQGTGDQNAFETLREHFMRLKGFPRQQAVDFHRQPRFPVLGKGRRCGLTQVCRQIGDINLLAGRHDGEPVTEVFKLTYVAGKIERSEVAQGRLGKALGFGTKFVRAFLQKVPCEKGNILTPVPQARQADPDDI